MKKTERRDFFIFVFIMIVLGGLAMIGAYHLVYDKPQVSITNVTLESELEKHNMSINCIEWYKKDVIVYNVTFEGVFVIRMGDGSIQPSNYTRVVDYNVCEQYNPRRDWVKPVTCNSIIVQYNDRCKKYEIVGW